MCLAREGSVYDAEKGPFLWPISPFPVERLPPRAHCTDPGYRAQPEPRVVKQEAGGGVGGSQWILGLLCFTAGRAPRALVWPGVTVTGGLSEWGREEHCVVLGGSHSPQPAGENLGRALLESPR